MMEAQELTTSERARLMGTKDYMGCPSKVWELVSQWNKKVFAETGLEYTVNVMQAPLLAAIYKAGQQARLASQSKEAP